MSICPIGIGIKKAGAEETQKTDDANNYEPIEKIEDNCRTMATSYESNKLTYEQYRDNESSEEQSWAEQAKMRANRTASTYNSYILENSYIWENNTPSGI